MSNETKSSPQEGFFAKIKADSAKYPSRFRRSPFLSPLRLVQLVFFVPGFQLALSIRIQEVIKKIPLIGSFLRRIAWYITSIYFGSEIYTKTNIGAGVCFPHPYGIVISDDCIIGKNVTIGQHVTIGRKEHDKPGDPTVEDGVTIYSSAVIAGSITIGKNAKIGANAVVLSDVPANTTAIGIPARAVSQ